MASKTFSTVVFFTISLGWVHMSLSKSFMNQQYTKLNFKNFWLRKSLHMEPP